MRNVEYFLVCVRGRSLTVCVVNLKALQRMLRGSDVVRYVQNQHLLPVFNMS